ncbi:hypothetical protein [Acinetobacter sp. YH12158]|uniref:hypothetical protein n=1 Tax=Acinetobacter TaxID=469 RepID=UPI00359FD996
MRCVQRTLTLDQVSNRQKVSGQVLPIQFSNDEATKRVVMHSAKPVINQHKAELQELAYK